VRRDGLGGAFYRLGSGSREHGVGSVHGGARCCVSSQRGCLGGAVCPGDPSGHGHASWSGVARVHGPGADSGGAGVRDVASPRQGSRAQTAMSSRLD
jgi:hypothetical protein